VRLRSTRASAVAAPRRASPWALDLDFTTGVLDPRISFSRASPAWHFNSAGVLVQAAANAPRFAFDPVTLQPLGLQMETLTRTNQQFQSAAGASVGSPGSLPAGWTISSGLGLQNGVTRSVVAAGTEAGVPYFDIRFQGTFTAAENTTIAPQPGVTVVAATPGQVWTTSGWWRVVSGTMPAPSSAGIAGLRTRYGSPGLLAQLGDSDTPRTAWGQTGRTTTAPAGTTVVGSDWVWLFPAGAAVDFVVRIGNMQLELGASQSSYIVPTGAATARQADVLTVFGTNFSSWWNTSSGTVLVESSGVDTFADFPAIVCFGNGTALTEEMSLYVSNNSSTRLELKSQSGAVQAFLIGGLAAAGAVRKSAFAWQANDFAFSSNGGAAVTDSSGLVPVVDRLSFASFVARGGGGGQSGQFIRRFRYSPTRMTNEQLQQLTA
jgi:hypothetical protein